LAAENTVAARIIADTGVGDVNDLDNEGHTALWHASRLWDAELTECIISKSSSPTIRLVFQPNKNGNTLLHTATIQWFRTADTYLANLLALFKSAPGLNAPNEDGISPLAGALSYDNYTSAKALVLAGCQIDGKARLQRLENLSVDG
jgi:ankyrin repeat protein